MGSDSGYGGTGWGGGDREEESLKSGGEVGADEFLRNF